jgi:hypothetical protein
MSPIFRRSESIADEFQIGPVIIAHPQPQAIDLVESGSELSAHRKPFNANLVVSNPFKISVIDAQRESNTIFVFDVSSLAAATVPVVQAHSNVSFHRSSRLSKTNDSWALWNDFDLEANKSLVELRSMISAIAQGFAPQRSEEFENLLGRALSAQGQPKELEQWARRLAQDVSNLDD